MMARENGYTYYEADFIMHLINPFVDPYVENPSMAMGKNKALKVGSSSLKSDQGPEVVIFCRAFRATMQRPY